MIKVDLNGRVAMVTGGASGISLEMASALGGAGAKVWIGDIDEAGGKKAEAKLSADGIKVRFHPLDVTQKSSVTKMVTDVLQADHRIDILFNGAGILPTEPVMSMTEAFWDRVMAINIKGVFLCSQAVLKPMIDAGYGRIISVTSGYAEGAVGAAAYAVTKAGIIAFTKSLAGEMKRTNADITVNALSPGATDTPLFRVGRSEEDIQLWKNRGLSGPGDMASVVLFLASPEGWVISGDVLLHKNNLGRLIVDMRKQGP
jgi:NAD(P)-dependent dehydrogenase (short-subunit alcohol dehydrogenase family)